MTLETTILHGGSFIEWRCGSGYGAKEPLRIAPDDLRLSFEPPLPRLSIQHKARGTLLWPAPRQARVVPGRAGAADLALPALPERQVKSVVVDVSGRYLPRAFDLTLGVATQQTIALYASPLGTRYGSAGGIQGRLAFADGTVAAWALLELTVTPTLGGPLQFIAQADQHGEFRLALDRLPALTRDAPAPSYGAKLSVRASASALATQPLDPAALTPVSIAKGKNAQGKSQFASTLSLDITPGTVSPVTSPKHELIVLKAD